MSNVVKRALELIIAEIQREKDAVLYLKAIRDCVVVNAMHTLGSTRDEAEAFANGTSETPFLTAMTKHVEQSQKEATLSAALEMPEIKAMRLALLNIGELNKTAADENGHKWDNSDLIAQEVFAALAQLKGAKP